MKNNLFISSNTLTMVIFAWIIERFYPNDNNILLVVTNHLELKFVQAMLDTAKNLNCFSKRLLFDTYAPTKMDSMVRTDEIEAFNVDNFQKDIGITDFDNIYTTYFYRHSKFMIEKYKNADVHVIENGTVSYFKQTIPIEIMNRIKTFFSFNYFNLLYPADVVKFPHIQDITIDKEAIKEKFELACGNSDEIEEDKDAIIICAQNISLNKPLMSTEYELSEYYKVVRSFLDMGYHVYFKDHPKTPDMFYKLLKDKIDSNNLKLIHNSAPIEHLASRMNPRGVVGIFTSSLLTIPYLYNIPSYCMMIRNNMARYRINELAYAMIMSYIPLLDKFDSDEKWPSRNVEFLNNPLVNMIDIMYRRADITTQEYENIHDHIDCIEEEFFKYFSTPDMFYKLCKDDNYEACRSYLHEAYKHGI